MNGTSGRVHVEGFHAQLPCRIMLITDADDVLSGGGSYTLLSMMSGVGMVWARPSGTQRRRFLSVMRDLFDGEVKTKGTLDAVIDNIIFDFKTKRGISDGEG